MRISIVGAGPAGTTAALLLARQGHRITLVDRDPGPRPGEAWKRVGVMQFHLPQMLRAPGRNLLAQRLPHLHQALVDAGAVVAAPPGGRESAANLQIRREVMERAMWEFTSCEPGITRVCGHAGHVASRRPTGPRLRAGTAGWPTRRGCSSCDRARIPAR
jgi:2-polyprenyl-6-methoxyphenol hydroxylase-like FAD-dependent oxidoreductase